MIFKNKRFFTLITLFFMVLGSLQSQDSVTDLQKANQLLTVAQERDRISSEELEDVKSRRLRMEEDLIDVQDNPKLMSKEDKKKLENDIKTLRKHEEVLVYKRKLASNLMLDVTDVLKASPKKRAKFIAEYEKRVAPIVLDGVVENPKLVTQVNPESLGDGKIVAPQNEVEKPIAQVENPSSNVNTSVSETYNPIPTATKTEPKPKKVSTKKPKTEKPKVAAVKTEPKPKPESKPKKESTKKPRVEKKTEDIAKTEVKPKSEPKNRKKETTKKPKVEKPPVVVAAETTENQVVAQTERVEKQPEIVAQPIGNSLETPVETVTNPVSKKKKEKQTKAPKSVSVRIPSENEDVSESKPKKKSDIAVHSESSKSSVAYKKYDAKEDVILNTPSTLDCNLAFDGMDNFTGKKKQETTPIILFAHTDDFMRPAMKNKEYVTCEAAATRVEGSRIVYLNLTITIQSKDAQRTFGFLDRGALIIFRFINGKKLSLATNKTDIGVVDIDKGTTTFRAQLAIAETVEYTASELDAIRVSWSIGYEDYEIYDMDILRNLFKCLDKK